MLHEDFAQLAKSTDGINAEFPARIKVEKQTQSGNETIHHMLACNDRVFNCNATGALVYLSHLLFNDPVHIIDTMSMIFTGKVVIADTDSSVVTSGHRAAATRDVSGDGRATTNEAPHSLQLECPSLTVADIETIIYLALAKPFSELTESEKLAIESTCIENYNNWGFTGCGSDATVATACTLQQLNVDGI